MRQPTFRRPNRSSDVTASVRSSLHEGDTAAAARSALATYGPEIFGFLIGALDDVDAARLLYADVGQRATSEIGGFAWRCSLRIWLYALARRELRDRRLRRRKTHGPPSGGAAESVATVSRRRAGLTGAIAAIRRALTLEDRELLILRVDRRLDWAELAATSLGEAASPEALAEERQRLRARMNEILERVERIAIQQRIVRTR